MDHHRCAGSDTDPAQPARQRRAPHRQGPRPHRLRGAAPALPKYDPRRRHGLRHRGGRTRTHLPANYQSANSKVVGMAGLGLAICRELAGSLGRRHHRDQSTRCRERVRRLDPATSLVRRRQLAWARARRLQHLQAPRRPNDHHGRGQPRYPARHRHASPGEATVIITASGRPHRSLQRRAQARSCAGGHPSRMSTASATRTIRSRGVHIPILALSARRHPDDRSAAASPAATPTKPIDADTLVSICRTVRCRPQAAWVISFRHSRVNDATKWRSPSHRDVKR